MKDSIILFKSKIFKKSTYKRVRIPCVITLESGRMLACFEGRKGASDWANIDIIYCSSDDGGKTFSNFKMAVCGNNTTLNNPCMVQDSNGTVHLMYCKNYAMPNGGGVFVKTSTDNGDSFGEERDITDTFKSLNASVIAIGPAHGIRTANNTLIFSLWYVKASEATSKKSHHPAVVTTVFSLDNGASWQLGEAIPTALFDINESAICNHKGGVLMNSRVHKLGYRATAFSKNGYSNWSEHLADSSIIDPTCQGSLASSNTGETYFCNCHNTKKRSNLTLFKYDTAYIKIAEVNKVGGYSNITITNNRLTIVYERRFGKEIAVATIDI